VRKPVASQTKVLRCAIYTRKSSEEGLEQDFNSLHAQRESCDAYIKSQRHEGWTPLPALYDDGGYSGGSTERPALKRLLVDVQSRLIDVVVVYKVDRLTRSLADFAKIVEIFDAAGVSFVSVTQQFNTTTSMGRLTLNVLLSFAQFEREVTGERIRDKIAASKQKGMWMGGWVPIGYDRKDRTLTINETEAVTVRTIFDLFLRLKNVQTVQAELLRLNFTTKPYETPRGRAIGGLPFARGHIYKILSNPLYIGEIAHRGVRYPGQHPPLIDSKQWDAAQAQLAANHHENRSRTNVKSKSLLAGLIYDDAGHRLVSSHATKNGKRYRYYVTSQGTGRPGGAPATSPLRLPAIMIDELFRATLQMFLRDKGRISLLLREMRCRPAEIGSGLSIASAIANSLTPDSSATHNFTELLARVTVNYTSLKISIKRDRLLAMLTENSVLKVRDIGLDDDEDNLIALEAPLPAVTGGSGKISFDDQDTKTTDAVVVKAIARASIWFEQLTTYKAQSMADIAGREGIEGGRLSVFVRRLDDQEHCRRLIAAFYKLTARRVFSERLDVVAPPFLRKGLRRPSLMIRRMPKRWGSYTPRGWIVLNVDLVRVSPVLIDYVICHELAHAFHPDHGTKWRNLLDAVMPDWEDRKSRLESALR
jgi:site-specific DNA recombinase